MTTDENEMPAYICNLKTEYYQAYFGDDSSYYLPLMIDFERGNVFKFNGWAFFCGMFWQLYRKLYVMILLSVIVGIIELTFRNWALSFWTFNGVSITLINLVVGLIFAIIYGYTGNYFLMRKAQGKIAQILATENDKDMILEKLQIAGSGNTLGVILVPVIIAGLIALAAVYSKIWG